MGITPRTVLDFYEDHGRLVAEKRVSKSCVGQVMGCLKTEKSTDELMQELRAEM